jgi:nucleoside-diphosphate-sugar epimerase
LNTIEDFINQYRMIFLTGGTGFIGSYLLAELVRAGHAVRALQRNRAIPSYLPREIAEKVEWVQGDILDTALLHEQVAGCNRIIHAAALVSFYPEDRKKLFALNIEGTANLVNTALENNITDFVYISSVSALGRPAGNEPVNEEKKWESSGKETNYAISKYHAEMEVWRGMGEGLTPLIVNPSTVLGYGDWNQGSCAIFRSVYREFPWYIKSNNGFVDVEDLAKAVVQLIETGKRNERFIISAENRNYRQIFNLIADGFHKKHPSREATPLLAGLAWRAEKFKSLLTGNKPLLTRETAAMGQRNRAYDNRKLLKALPGFQYRPLEEAIQKACARYLEDISRS